MSSFDKLPSFPSLDFDIYIDDTGVSCTGSRKHVISSIVTVSLALHHAITDDNEMNCQLALDKICTVASSKGLATALAAALGQFGGKFTAST
eukprot:5460296-Pyramimonas_sp.AAC.1